MTSHKNQPTQTFPVMDGAISAPRADQIAGIVQRVWAESRIYHEDVEPLLAQWLAAVGCEIKAEEFAMLLAKARGEFARIAVTEDDGAAHCPSDDLVRSLYWDVQRFESDDESSIGL